MGSFTDFSQLKKFKPAAPQPVAPPPPSAPEDRALAAAGSSADYFSSLLGGNEAREKPKSATPAPARRTTIVTPATVARVREEQAEEARNAERAAFAAREAALQEELEIQKTVAEDLAADLASARMELESTGTMRDALETERSRLEEENHRLEGEARRLEDELAAERAAPRQDPALAAACADKDRELAAQAEEIARQRDEIERLRTQLAEAQRTSLSSSVLLEKPATFSEKFPGELREHVVEAIADAVSAAEAGGRDRRARILEAVLVANPSSGELEHRREAVKQIVKEAGSRLDNAALAELEKLGFRYISGNKHHKLEWAGIRFPLAKTPSDYRSCLNSAAEICNRVF